MFCGILSVTSWLRCECEAHIKTPGPSHLEICRKGLESTFYNRSQGWIQAFLASFFAKMYGIDINKV